MTEAESRVEILLGRAVSAGLAPSMVATWGSPGRFRHKVAVGHSRLESPSRRADGATWYDLASITKPLVTGTLALIACREPGFGLTTTVGEVLNGFATRAIGRATVGNLLSHCSGLPAWLPIYALSADPSDVVDAITEVDLEASPETRVEYSCPGFILLGKILEGLFGESLDACFGRLVSGPLGLEDELGFRPDPRCRSLAGGPETAKPETDLAVEQGFDLGKIPPVGEGRPHDGNARYLDGVAGNSGLFGTGAGVFRLASEYTSHGQGLLEPEEIRAATIKVASGPHQIRGLGWQLSSTPGCSAGPGLGARAFGHVGFTGTSVWVDPDLDSVFVLLANRCHPDYRTGDLHPLRRRFHCLAAGAGGA